MKRPHIICLILTIQICLLSCKDSIQEVDDPRNYSPLEIGRFHIYNVIEENYFSGVSQPTILNYQEKEQITAYKGDNLFIVALYRRPNVNASWTKDKEFSIQLYPDRLIKNIDNKNYVYLTFPIQRFYEWNGNIYNDLEEKSYRYTEVSTKAVVNDIVFEKTIKVVEDNAYFNEDILGLDRAERILAYNVGLVYEQQTTFQYCQETEDCIGEKIIESGTRKTREIVTYGTE